MPEKRKRAADSKRKPKKQKVEQLTKLTDLPQELLDMVLSYALPDPSDFKWAIDPRGTAKLFTQSILQTSRSLREQCLRYIHGTCIWVYLHCDTPDSFKWAKSSLPRLPFVPNDFRDLIPADAAKVHISSRRRLSKRTVDVQTANLTMISPFNLDTLFWIRHFLKAQIDYQWTGTLYFNLVNITGRAEKVVNTAITAVFATSTDFFKLFSLHFLRNNEPFYSEDTSDNLFCKFNNTLRNPQDSKGRLQITWVNNALQESHDFLRRADLLEAFGHRGKAGFLLLANPEIWHIANSILPSPDDWALGEDESSARCSRGNELRRLVHQIEFRACLAYVRLSEEYGRTWCETHHELFEDPNERFFHQSPKFQFGLSPPELADYHYGCALLQEELGRSEFEHRSPLTAPLKTKKAKRIRQKELETALEYLEHLEMAISELFIARMLRPDDMKIRDLYRSWKKIYGKEDARELEMHFSMNYKSPPLPGTNFKEEVIWAGDENMLDTFGSERVLAHLPLAQKGLEISQTFTQWYEISRHHRV